MTQPDKYADFAERYDAMVPANPEREAFFRELFRRRGVSRVLGCACGTGDDLLLLHSLGSLRSLREPGALRARVCGSDLSEAMLRVCRRKLEERGADIPLRQADFQELDRHFAPEFDAVLCLSNAINEEEVDAERALRSMRSVLRPGGIIVFDQGQTDRMMADPPRYSAEVNDSTLSRLFVMDYQGRLMTVQVFDFIHDEREGIYDLRRNEFKIHIRLLADWVALLARAGMSAQFFGDWQGSPYRVDSSRRLIAVAQGGL